MYYMAQTEYINQETSEGFYGCPMYLTKIVKKAQFFRQYHLISQGILQVDLNYRPILIVLVDNTLQDTISN